MKGGGQQRHLAWPVEKGSTDFPGIDDQQIIDPRLLQCDRDAQTCGSRSNNEYLGLRGFFMIEFSCQEHNETSRMRLTIFTINSIP